MYYLHYWLAGTIERKAANRELLPAWAVLGRKAQLEAAGKSVEIRDLSGRLVDPITLEVHRRS